MNAQFAIVCCALAALALYWPLLALTLAVAWFCITFLGPDDPAYS